MPIILLFVFILKSAALRAEGKLPWEDNISSPAIMSSFFIKDISKLPTQGIVKKDGTLWSSDYWPNLKGGIDQRWFASNQKQRLLPPPNRNESLGRMINELTYLSPAEKYDLLIARYDYPLKKWVRSLIHPNSQIWEGICHGWGPASINHIEPRPRMLKNPDGVEIPFSSADIKALLSFYYAFAFEVDNTHQMGKRCEAGSSRSSDSDCTEDLNAGAFHIVLANKIGLLNESFMVDTQRLREVWNNPIYSYKSQIIQTLRPLKDSHSHTEKVLRVKTQVTYVDSVTPQWQTILNSKNQKYDTNNYEYYLDIDQNENIIGGKWISVNRPDFIWQKRRPARFAGLLSQLGRLLYE